MVRKLMAATLAAGSLGLVAPPAHAAFACVLLRITVRGTVVEQEWCTPFAESEESSAKTREVSVMVPL